MRADKWRGICGRGVRDLLRLEANFFFFIFLFFFFFFSFFFSSFVYPPPSPPSGTDGYLLTAVGKFHRRAVLSRPLAKHKPSAGEAL